MAIHGGTRTARPPHVRHHLHTVGALLHHAWVEHVRPGDAGAALHARAAMHARGVDDVARHVLHGWRDLAWAQGDSWSTKARPAIRREWYQRPLLRGPMACK